MSSTTDGDQEPREPVEGAEPESGAPQEEQQGPVPPELPMDEETGAAPTNYGRNIWLLLVILGVIMAAWLIGRPAGGDAPESAGPDVPAPVAAPPVAPPSPPPTHEELLQHQTNAVRQRTFLPVGSDRLLLLAPATVEATDEGEFLQARVFDVTKRTEAFRLENLLAISVSRAVPVLSRSQETPPRFVPAKEVDFLVPSETVIALRVGEVTRAYPVRILRAHTAIVDQVGSTYLLVCFSWHSHLVSAFELPQTDAATDWHKAGWLHRGNVVLFDSATGSLWDVLSGRAFAGERSGAALKPVPAVLHIWEAWHEANPDALVLSMDTGYPDVKEQGGYDERVLAEYQRYLADPAMGFVVPDCDPSKEPAMPLKRFVVGVESGDESRAYPIGELARAKEAGMHPVEDELGGRKVEISLHDVPAVTAADAEGNPIPARLILWFAWRAAHPDTGIWRSAWRPPDTPGGAETDAETDANAAKGAAEGSLTDETGKAEEN